MLRDTVVFPGIVSKLCDAPCQSMCELKTHKEGALSISGLESALCAHLDTDKLAKPRKSAPKTKKIAVYGSGPAALTFAYSMGVKGYEVRVFEASEHIGGVLCEKLTPDAVRRELSERFAGLDVTFEINHGGEAPENGAFDAVLYTEKLPCAANEGSSFVVAADKNASPVAALAWGTELARQMEGFLLSGVRFEAHMPSCTPDGGAGEKMELSADELKAEAERCLQCRCDRCIRVCPLMNSGNLDPFKLKDRLSATLRKDLFNPVNYTKTFDACTFCGKCTAACEEGVDLKAWFGEARFRLKESGRMTPAYHDFWLRDMEHACNDVGFYLPPSKSAGYIYFPGCQLGAMRPETVERSFERLRERFPGTGLLLSCCGTAAQWAGDREKLEERLEFFRKTLESAGDPTVITACSGCRRFFETNLPEVKTASLYELWPVMDGEGYPTEGSFAVYDPCGGEESRDGSRVREMLQTIGIEYREIAEEFKGGCCGFGGHISGSNREYASQLREKLLSAEENSFIVYCAGCMHSFLSQGRECVHILDVLCGLPRAGSEAPTYSQRRRNRELLRGNMEKKYLPEREVTMPQGKKKIFIPEHLQRKMQDELICEDDIILAVEAGEKGAAVFDESDGCLVSRAQVGCITVWVRYRRDGELVLTESVYCHRMRIEVEADG